MMFRNMRGNSSALVMVFILLMCIAIPTSIIGALLFGQVYERNNMPVAGNFTVKIISVDSDYIILDVEGEKYRDCRFLDIAALVLRDGRKVRGTIDFVEDHGKAPSSRPKGRQHFGTWRIFPAGSHVLIQSRHKCHGLWEQVTTLVDEKITGAFSFEPPNE